MSRELVSYSHWRQAPGARLGRRISCFQPVLQFCISCIHQASTFGRQRARLLHPYAVAKGCRSGRRSGEPVRRATWMTTGRSLRTRPPRRAARPPRWAPQLTARMTTETPFGKFVSLRPQPPNPFLSDLVAVVVEQEARRPVPVQEHVPGQLAGVLRAGWQDASWQKGTPSPNCVEFILLEEPTVENKQRIRRGQGH